jgi:hypothetical protein
MANLISLSDARLALGMTATGNDAELNTIITRAEAYATKRCGPLQATVYTARLNGDREKLILNTTPVISLTSVTDVRTAVPVNISLLNASRSGVVEFLAGGYFGGLFYDVVYAAGRTICPVDLYDGVLELVRHLWQTQRGGTKRPGGPDSVPAAGYLYPYRVESAFEPHLQGGFA